MKISEIFYLEKSQRELDFIDINIEKDLPLFLDPYFIGTLPDPWAVAANRTIQSFFQHVIGLLNAGQRAQTRNLFQYLHEPNETCLGVSTTRPRGRGVGIDEATAIFDSIINSRAIEYGVVNNLEDFSIFVDNVGKDKISDLTTNLIRKHLVEYTQNQCKLHGIQLTTNVQTGYYWDARCLRWHNETSEMLVIEDRIILLVPKGVVSFSYRYTPDVYCRHFVLNFLQNEHLRLLTPLVTEKRLKNRTIKREVYKKDLIEEFEPFRKEYLRDFTRNHPQIFQQFREQIKSQMQSVSDDKLEEDPNFKLKDFIGYLKIRLSRIPAGRNDANLYHSHIMGILEFLFYPNLVCPVKEQDIDEGRKRVDITFENAAKGGFFHRLHAVKQIPCSYVFVECKNYSRDIANPELDQMSGRFSPNSGRFGIVVCRTIEDIDLFLLRCRDSHHAGRGTIIPVVDNDIVQMLNEIQNGNRNAIDDFLTERLRNVILG
jgi:hypothetical protein